MKNLTKQFLDLFQHSEEFQRGLGDYSRVIKTQEWKFLSDAIQMIKGQMAIDMFSRKHTDLSKDEKDVAQRTYYNTNLILDFLLNPQAWVKKKVNVAALMQRVRPTNKGR